MALGLTAQQVAIEREDFLKLLRNNTFNLGRLFMRAGQYLNAGPNGFDMSPIARGKQYYQALQNWWWNMGGGNWADFVDAVNANAGSNAERISGVGDISYAVVSAKRWILTGIDLLRAIQILSPAQAQEIMTSITAAEVTEGKQAAADKAAADRAAKAAAAKAAALNSTEQQKTESLFPFVAAGIALLIILGFKSKRHG